MKIYRNRHYATSHKTEDDQFSKFMLEEYKNISSAHFNANNAVASFFKYYLVVISLPISIMVSIVAKKEFNPQKLDVFLGGASKNLKRDFRISLGKCIIAA